jgi:hypothetical protein
MSLLDEIEEAAIDPKTDILVVLRKCRVLASRLNHAELKRWVESELDGYASVEGLPAYRVIRTLSLGHFSGPFGSGLRNASIPLTCVPENARDLVENARLTQSISAIAELAKHKDDNLRISWPPELVGLVAGNVYESMNMMQAWQVITRATLVGIVETVRNKVLTFALEIAEAAPTSDGKAAAVPQERVSHIFNTVIMGSVGNYAAGSANFSQQHSSVVAGDFGSLRRALADIGVENDDISDLQTAVEKDKRLPSTKRFGSRVSGWIGKMVAKSAQGLWQISTSVASDVLSKMLASYYNLPA